MSQCACGRSPDPGIRPGGGCCCVDLPACEHGWTIWPREESKCPKCVQAALAGLRAIAEDLLRGCGCREELGAEGNFDKCWKPAEFVLWGKLIPPEGLGPRCYDHAVKHVGHRALTPGSNYALIDLRPLRAAMPGEER